MLELGGETERRGLAIHRPRLVFLNLPGAMDDVGMSEQSDMSDDNLREIARSSDMFDRLAGTLSQPDIDATVTRAIILQLAGAPEQSKDLGQNRRGDIHVAVVADTATNFSQFLSAVEDLAPQSSVRLNGTSTSVAGAIGSPKGGSLTRGPLLDEDVELSVIERMDAADTGIHEAFQQILDVGSYSFTKASYRETVSAPGSILIGANPKYGDFDELQPLVEQLALSRSVQASVDLTLVNQANDVDAVTTSEDVLEPAVARDYLSLAKTYNPTVTEDASKRIDRFVDRVIENADDDGDLVYVPGYERLRESITRLASAHARLWLREQTTVADAKRAIDLIESPLETFGLIDETPDFDADMVETSSSARQRDRIQNLKGIVVDIEDEYDEGAPIDVVIERAEEVGIDESKAEHEIEKLKQKAEVYEPRSDYLRST